MELLKMSDMEHDMELTSCVLSETLVEKSSKTFSVSKGYPKNSDSIVVPNSDSIVAPDSDIIVDFNSDNIVAANSDSLIAKGEQRGQWSKQLNPLKLYEIM